MKELAESIYLMAQGEGVDDKKDLPPPDEDEDEYNRHWNGTEEYPEPTSETL